MPHRLIASLAAAAAAIITGLPTHVQASGDIQVAMADPPKEGAPPPAAALLRVKGSALGGVRWLPPVIHGPDYFPMGQAKDGSGGRPNLHLRGDRFRFH
jgi:hypothetical protein